jgi:hypothetical protein
MLGCVGLERDDADNCFHPAFFNVSFPFVILKAGTMVSHLVSLVKLL